MQLFNTIFAKIFAALPFALGVMNSVETLAAPGKLTSDQKVQAMTTALHGVLDTEQLVTTGQIADPAAYNYGVAQIAAGAHAIHQSLKK